MITALLKFVSASLPKTIPRTIGAAGIPYFLSNQPATPKAIHGDIIKSCGWVKIKEQIL